MTFYFLQSSNTKSQYLITNLTLEEVVGLLVTKQLKISLTFTFSIEGEYVPLPGDWVTYRICQIPPKFEKYQAIHVQITNLTPEVHVKWETASNEHH